MKEDIQKFFKGEILDDASSLETYSKDASLFKVRPEVVVQPRDSADLKGLVKWASSEHDRSITMRAAGTDMTGGPLNESVIADVTQHMNKIGDIDEESIVVEPGAYYRDFEKKTLEQDLILPCYPASKGLCALGGMVANNCGGERTLRYGKMEDYVLESKVILSDGNEYEVKPLSEPELKKKMDKSGFEGNVYKRLYKLIEDNREIIEQARPKVSKNSSGYYLWNVYKDKVFDLNKLLVGSQGTLGIVTEAKVKLVKEKKYHDMVALFFKSWEELPQVVNAILPHEPESLEAFDDETLKLGIRFMPEIAKKTGSSLLSFALKFLPEALIGVQMMSLPKLIILVEISEDTEEKVREKTSAIIKKTRDFHLWSRVIEKDSEEEKFWTMRRESFNLLRKHVKGKRTAPFIEDFCVPTDDVPEFLPKALSILADHGIKANIAGHAGNGNFHIIPLMDLKKESERDKIVEVSDKFYDLVAKYGGSLSGEHNDGIVRTPFLSKMYGPEVLELFRQTKEIFDPQNIFNPGKKVPSNSSGQVGGSIEYLENHISHD